MKLMLIPLLSLVLAMPAFAALLTPEGQGPKLENMQLPAAGTTLVEGETVKLTSIGAGLRSKKVVFVNVKVYVGQLYADAPDKLKKNSAEVLASLKDQKAIAMQLHFTRDVDADNVQKSFREALQANGNDSKEATMTQFLDSVSKGGEAKKGKALTILGTKLKDGSEVISYENTNGDISQIKGSAGFIEKVFSIWLGKSADPGVAELKKNLLK